MHLLNYRLQRDPWVTMESQINKKLKIKTRQYCFIILFKVINRRLIGVVYSAYFVCIFEIENE